MAPLTPRLPSSINAFMILAPDILCIGSVLWDIIGRTRLRLHHGADVPGRITRLPGGVAMNIALTLRHLGLRPAILTAIGRDPEGEQLVAEAKRRGLITDFMYRSEVLPTDRYMAIEGDDGLAAAIADAHSLEAAGEAILTPLEDGRLGSADRPWPGPVALDGNLTVEVLARISVAPYLASADLRVAAASPGKADRLRPVLNGPNATIYVNLAEAGLLCGKNFANAAQAAEELMAEGVHRVLVTDGPHDAALGDRMGVVKQRPPSVRLRRVTGAGDTFMATHIVAEHNGMSRLEAFTIALEAAAAFVSKDDLTCCQ